MKKIVAWLKKHWLMIVMVVSGIVALIFRRKIPDFSADYAKIKKIHDDELAAIDVSRKVNVDERTRNEVNHEQALKDVAAEAEKHATELSTRETTEVERLIKQGQDDIDALADTVSKATGFKVITPKE